MCQQTYLKLWEHIETLYNKNIFQQRAWLYTVAKNVKIDYLRYKSRHQQNFIWQELFDSDKLIEPNLEESILIQKAIDEGLHKLINFDGPVMTDSGSFQLSVYGDVDITNSEVIEFQELIKTDIGTSLDIPTAPFVERQKAEEDLEITLERAKEAVKIKKENNPIKICKKVVKKY